eukprot:m.86678 g.86678  ORF g.86678 m.86678 type:complete len:102 (+) comp13064_c0_seq3:171-476(+)
MQHVLSTRRSLLIAQLTENRFASASDIICDIEEGLRRSVGYIQKAELNLRSGCVFLYSPTLLATTSGVTTDFIRSQSGSSPKFFATAICDNRVNNQEINSS